MTDSGTKPPFVTGLLDDDLRQKRPQRDLVNFQEKRLSVYRDCVSIEKNLDCSQMFSEQVVQGFQHPAVL